MRRLYYGINPLPNNRRFIPTGESILAQFSLLIICCLFCQPIWAAGFDSDAPRSSKTISTSSRCREVFDSTQQDAGRSGWPLHFSNLTYRKPPFFSFAGPRIESELRSSEDGVLNVIVKGKPDRGYTNSELAEAVLIQLSNIFHEFRRIGIDLSLGTIDYPSNPYPRKIYVIVGSHPNALGVERTEPGPFTASLFALATYHKSLMKKVPKEIGVSDVIIFVPYGDGPVHFIRDPNTLAHELGHKRLKRADFDDFGNIMEEGISDFLATAVTKITTSDFRLFRPRYSGPYTIHSHANGLAHKNIRVVDNKYTWSDLLSVGAKRNPHVMSQLISGLLYEVAQTLSTEVAIDLINAIGDSAPYNFGPKNSLRSRNLGSQSYAAMKALEKVALEKLKNEELATLINQRRRFVLGN